MSRDTTKPAKWGCAQGRLRSAWASAQSDQSSLSAWRNLGFLAPIKRTVKTDQTGQMPRLIWVFGGHTTTLLVLSCRGSNVNKANSILSLTVRTFDFIEQDLCAKHWWDHVEYGNTIWYPNLRRDTERVQKRNTRFIPQLKDLFRGDVVWKCWWMGDRFLPIL